MKKIAFIFLLLCVVMVNGFAFLSKNSEIVKTTESIRYLSQKIANDYIYYCNNTKRTELKESLNLSIKLLEKDFRYVAKNTTNMDIKNILDYLSYSKDEIKDLLKKDVKLDHINLMLDYTESLYEGSESILNSFKYTDKNIKVHLMRVSKIYMAIHVGDSTILSSKLLKDEMNIVDVKLKTNNFWRSLKEILNLDKDLFVPNIVTILIKKLEKNII